MMKFSLNILIGLCLLSSLLSGQEPKGLFEKYAIIYYYQNFGSEFSQNSHIEVTAVEDPKIVEVLSKTWIVGHYHTIKYKEATHKKVRVKISIDYENVFRIVSFQDESAFKKVLENLREVKYWLKVEEPVIRIPSTPLVPVLPRKPVRTSP